MQREQATMAAADDEVGSEPAATTGQRTGSGSKARLRGRGSLTWCKAHCPKATREGQQSQ